MKKNKIKEASLVIPLFNNEKTLVKQINACNKILKETVKDYEIIVANDASTDNSKKLLDKYFSKKDGFKIITNNKNLGIAKNILNLYKNAKFEYIVLFSVDGDWNPKDIGRLLIKANNSSADIVIGKRSYETYPIKRKLISFFYNLLPIIIFGVNTIDAGSIKVIKKQIINKTHIISKSVFFEAELIIRSKKNHKNISFINVDFNRRTKNSSGANIKLITSSMIDLVNLRFKI